ncbi:Bug family tripartite tricarboxylate transporter substrate binding protein [Protaetiibacter larvae]|uniref:Tripartite tricarboxylate transporter substrate binding protein n=1 Tax=Protaetiibacter larvae TaxID=2592654 RepID=A0A5C1Y6R8_9MICO|nr:tripartite tricarboxylate transporter substrate-binding protein [Protaetiibacter larvae]QEO09501.1 tripartite tricarboxylate transporter substrate binding protein [Protaetiibacter larvae]
MFTRTHRTRVGVVAGIALAALALTGCQAKPADAGAADADFPSQPFTITVPSGPGGGLDQLGRSVQLALTESGLVSGNIQVFNNPGAGSMLGLNQFVREEEGEQYQLLAVSAVLLGAEKTSDIKVTVEGDTTPIAALASEYLTIVTRPDSGIKDLKGLVDKLKKDPGSVNIVGSVAGSLEQVLIGLLAQSQDIDPADINYVPYENASEQVTALLSGDADVSVMGISEILSQLQDGSAIPLVVSSPERLDGVDAPTFEEAGLPADLTMANWRGIVGPPGLSDAQRDQVVDLIAKMRETDQWKEILTAKSWADTFIGGADFDAYLKSESDRIGNAMKGLGLIDG